MMRICGPGVGLLREGGEPLVGGCAHCARARPPWSTPDARAVAPHPRGVVAGRRVGSIDFAGLWGGAGRVGRRRVRTLCLAFGGSGYEPATYPTNARCSLDGGARRPGFNARLQTRTPSRPESTNVHEGGDLLVGGCAYCARARPPWSTPDARAVVPHPRGVVAGRRVGSIDFAGLWGGAGRVGRRRVRTLCLAFGGSRYCAVSSLLRHLSVMTSETFECHDF